MLTDYWRADLKKALLSYALAAVSAARQLVDAVSVRTEKDCRGLDLTVVTEKSIL